jgi:hypothetical protein
MPNLNLVAMGNSKVFSIRAKLKVIDTCFEVEPVQDHQFMEAYQQSTSIFVHCHHQNTIRGHCNPSDVLGIFKRKCPCLVIFQIELCDSVAHRTVHRIAIFGEDDVSFFIYCSTEI